MTREEAINLLDNLIGMVEDNQQSNYDEAFKMAIRSLKSWDEDVAPVVHGEWVVKGQEVYCSKCKNISGYNWHGASAFSKFCPNCGAKMDGGRDDKQRSD